MLTRIELKKFTAFEDLKVELSPGVNIFLGENSTGKTHLMKALYAGSAITESSKSDFAQKITNVFSPVGKQISRLVKRSQGNNSASIKIFRAVAGKKLFLNLSFGRKSEPRVTGATKEWMEYEISSIFIPVKDMMANSKGFGALYESHNIPFEEIYDDILNKAFWPALKGQPTAERKKLMRQLEKVIDGKVIEKSEVFYLKNKHGELEFSLLAEGHRKLGLLWLLIQNGMLLTVNKNEETVLFWDEPETNMNPKQMQTLIGVLLDLQRNGVQLFIATHDYLILKEFDLQRRSGDEIKFHTLHRRDGEVEVSYTNNFNDIDPNAIDDAYGDVLDRDFAKTNAS